MSKPLLFLLTSLSLSKLFHPEALSAISVYLRHMSQTCPSCSVPVSGETASVQAPFDFSLIPEIQVQCAFGMSLTPSLSSCPHCHSPFPSHCHLPSG